MSILCTICPESVDKRIAKLTNELPLIQARAVKEPRLQTTLQQIRSEILLLSQGNEKVWSASHTFHVWGKTPNEVDHLARELKRRGNQAEGAVIVQEEHALWELRRAASPGWTRDKDRYRFHLYNTSQLVSTLPLGGQPNRLKDATSVILETATGSLFNFNPHDQKKLNNYNMLMIGGSGTGKSFLATTMLMQMQRSNVRVVGVDLGGSYKSLCNCLGGSYITMNIDSLDQTINPLYLPPNEPVEPSDINRMILFVEKLLLERHETRLNKVQNNALNEALRAQISKAEGKEFYLRNLKDFLEKLDKPLADRMAGWIKGGRYGRLFDGPTRLDLNNPFCIFDMSDIKDNPEIAPLMLMSIINAVSSMAKQYPGDPKILLLDEAWFMLQDPIIGAFVAECFRTFRKLGVGVLGISQGIEEWTGISQKTAILNNTSTFIVLRQSAHNAAAMAAQELHLNAQEQGILTNLQTIPGVMSQALFHQTKVDGVESLVIVNRPTPLLYSIATTNVTDRREKERLHDEDGLTHLEAVVEFARRYPRGTMNGRAA